MTTAPPACPAHRDLVDAALGPDPDDAALERYAAEVPSCEACRRALAVQVGAHPGRFAAPPDRSADPLAGMEALAAALDARPRRRWPLVVAVAAAVLAAVVLAGRLVPDSGAPGSADPTPVARTEAPPRQDGVAEPAPAAPEARPTAPPSPSAPEVREVRSAPEDRGAPAGALVPSDDDAVAQLDDWPPPPFEELRAGREKGPAAAVRRVELVVAGAPRVGGSVGLTLVSSAEAEVAVCVEGPERGVVWRGGIPPGRTELSRGGRAQRFAFSAPGRYRFVVSSGAERCGDPIHVVELEVGR